MNQDADVIFIGSGMGTLACASILARMKGMKALILEKHFKAGGFTHTFKRKGYVFDVGLHYVGQMAEGEEPRLLFDYITGGGVHWNKMPSVFEHYVYPDFTVKVPDDEAAYRNHLFDLFPEEKAGIRTYFHDLHEVRKWLSNEMMSNMTPKPVGAFLKFFNSSRRKTSLLTTGEYLEEHFRSDHIKAALTSFWGDYGLPPSLSAFGQHAIVAAHYLGGAYYPIGSASTIAESISKVLEVHDGKILLNHEVQEILIEGNVAAGVRALHRSGNREEIVEYRAPLIISDAGRLATLCHMLPESSRLPLPEAKLEPTSAIVLFVGLKEDPSKLGFRGENHWLFSGYDHDAFYNRTDILEDLSISELYLSFPSLKDPDAEKHTAQIICMARASAFSAWKETEWLKRGSDYEDLKERLTEKLIDQVEQYYPGLKELIDYTELSTPLTVKSFTSHEGGAIYGIPATPEELAGRDFLASTPVKNLYLTGSDVMLSGIVGALMGGVSAASSVLGNAGFLQIVGAARKA